MGLWVGAWVRFPSAHSPIAIHIGGGVATGGAGRLCGGCGLTSSPNGQPLLLTKALLFTSTAHDAASGSSGRIAAGGGVG